MKNNSNTMLILTVLTCLFALFYPSEKADARAVVATSSMMMNSSTSSQGVPRIIGVPLPSGIERPDREFGYLVCYYSNGVSCYRKRHKRSSSEFLEFEKMVGKYARVIDPQIYSIQRVSYETLVIYFTHGGKL